MKLEEIQIRLQKKRIELGLEDPKNTNSLMEKLWRKVDRLREMSSKIDHPKESSENFVSYKHRRGAYRPAVEKAVEEELFIWKKYELDKVRKNLDRDRKFVRMQLERIMGRGYNSQKLMILLENSSGEYLLGKAEISISWGKDLESKVISDGFVLHLEYINQTIRQAIYSIAKEEYRVLLN